MLVPERNVRRHGGRRRVGLVLSGLATVMMAACSTTSSPSAGNTPGTGNSSAPTTTASLSTADLASQQALAAYTGMWQSMAQADQTADWQSPVLAKYATGDALGVISRSLYTDHMNGVVSTGAPVLHPHVTKVDPPTNPTTVTISDCGDSTNWLKHKQDGSSLNDTGGRRSITAEVKKQDDGSWRVIEFAVEGLGSC
jgi:hypothetical protein